MISRPRTNVLNMLPSDLLKWPVKLKCIGNGGVLISFMWCAFSCLEQSAFLFTHSWAAAKHWIAVSTNRDRFIPRNCDLFVTVQTSSFCFLIFVVPIFIFDLQWCLPVCSVPQPASMDSESEALMKEYSKMMTDMIVLCTTLALSLFFWIVSLAISTYSGERLSLPSGPSLLWLLCCMSLWLAFSVVKLDLPSSQKHSCSLCKRMVWNENESGVQLFYWLNWGRFVLLSHDPLMHKTGKPLLPS